MKLSVLQENLLHGLNTAGRFVAARAQLPILSNVLLATDKGRLKISATNLETGINLWVGAKVEKEGTITIPARIFAEFVSSLPADKIEIEVKENKLFLSCGSYQADFLGLSSSEFPLVPSLSEKTQVNFEGDEMATAFNFVTFAAATDESRPTFTGVWIATKEGQLILIATDGYRLSIKKLNPEVKKNSGKNQVINWDQLEDFKNGLIIPARTLIELARIIKDLEEKELKLAVTPKASQVIFALPEVEVVSRLIEGKFPASDYEEGLPDKASCRVIVDREDLTRAVRMASTFARESANIVKFEAENTTLKISANTAQVGSNLSQIEADVEGEKSKIAFNCRYLLDLLNVINSEKIIVEMNGALKPGVFRLQGDPSFLHVIMPVRVQE